MLMKIFAALCIACSLCVSSGVAQTASPLVLKRKIVLTGVKGKFDHFAIDESGNRLFAAATGNKSVEVIDLTSDRIVESLNGLGKPHGLAWVGAKGRLFVADGEKASLEVFEGKPLKMVKTIPLSNDADDMAYDAASGLLYVGHGGDAANPASVAVIDTDRLTLVKQLPMGAHPEALELDEKGRRVFVNVSDTGEIAIVDAATQMKTKTWKLAGAKGNTPLAYDAADNVVLVGVRTPAKLVALNGPSGKEIAAIPSDTGADDLFYEPATRRAYLITGSGAVDSYAVSPEGKLTALGVTHTAAGAKTGLLVPSQGLLYIGVPGVSVPSEIDIYATQGR